MLLSPDHKPTAPTRLSPAETAHERNTWDGKGAGLYGMRLGEQMLREEVSRLTEENYSKDVRLNEMTIIIERLRSQARLVQSLHRKSNAYNISGTLSRTEKTLPWDSSSYRDKFAAEISGKDGGSAVPTYSSLSAPEQMTSSKLSNTGTEDDHWRSAMETSCPDIKYHTDDQGGARGKVEFKDGRLYTRVGHVCDSFAHGHRTDSPLYRSVRSVEDEECGADGQCQSFYVDDGGLTKNWSKMGRNSPKAHRPKEPPSDKQPEAAEARREMKAQCDESGSERKGRSVDQGTDVEWDVPSDSPETTAEDLKAMKNVLTKHTSVVDQALKSLKKYTPSDSRGNTTEKATIPNVRSRQRNVNFAARLRSDNTGSLSRRGANVGSKPSSNFKSPQKSATVGPGPNSISKSPQRSTNAGSEASNNLRSPQRSTNFGTRPSNNSRSPRRSTSAGRRLGGNSGSPQRSSNFGTTSISSSESPQRNANDDSKPSSNTKSPQKSANVGYGVSDNSRSPRRSTHFGTRPSTNSSSPRRSTNAGSGVSNNLRSPRRTTNFGTRPSINSRSPRRSTSVGRRLGGNSRSPRRSANASPNPRSNSISPQRSANVGSVPNSSAALVDPIWSQVDARLWQPRLNSNRRSTSVVPTKRMSQKGKWLSLPGFFH